MTANTEGLIKELSVLQQREKEIALAEQQKIEQGQMQQSQQALTIREAEKSIISDQIELGEIKEEIENLLKGKVLKTNDEGITTWENPTDPEMIILSEHGVHLIMNTISFYLNKNTLLSNYDEDTIFQKMEDFATDLADTIFMEYEKVFQYPTEEELQDKLKERLAKKTERRKFAYELMGKEVSKEEIKQQFVKEIEHKIEEEITKIREQIIKNKLKRFVILIRMIQDTVHSAYLRALGGAERRTLRQHIHVSETRGLGGYPPPSQTIKKTSSLNPAKWFGR